MFADGELVMEYAWDDNMLVGAADDNQITSEFNLFNPLDTSQESIVINDHLNTPRAVFNASSTLIWRWNDYGFGAQQADEDPDGDNRYFRLGIRFAGQYYDTETQLHYNHHRYYDAEKGRYISSDPIGLAGGLNTYLYANGNAVNYADPLGLMSGLPSRDEHINRNRNNRCPKKEPGANLEGETQCSAFTKDEPGSLASRVNGGKLKYRHPSGYECFYDADGNLLPDENGNYTYNYHTGDTFKDSLIHGYKDVLPEIIYGCKDEYTPNLTAGY